MVEKSDEWDDNHQDHLDGLENLARLQFAGARLHGAADLGSVCYWTNVTGVFLVRIRADIGLFGRATVLRAIAFIDICRFCRALGIDVRPGVEVLSSTSFKARPSSLGMPISSLKWARQENSALPPFRLWKFGSADGHSQPPKRRQRSRTLELLW